MSTFEKIALGIIGLLVVALVVFSYHELTEPSESSSQRGPDFNESLGSNFRMGPFDVVLGEQSSGGSEDNCAALQTVIVGTLHDIDERLEQMGVYPPSGFEVNAQTLSLLCNKNAQITLADEQGDKLLLQKVPFTRKVPPGGMPNDIGTDVHIDATVIAPGAVPPTQPTTYGDELIPDRYLDIATSSHS